MFENLRSYHTELSHKSTGYYRQITNKLTDAGAEGAGGVEIEEELV